jgi:serine/threonine protein phosphatase PrpC
MKQQNFSSGGPQLHVSVAGRSESGQVRERNEDAIARCEPADQLLSAQFGWLYLLADGVGGYTGGEIASRLAVETIAAAYYTASAPAHHVAESAFQPQEMVMHLNGQLAALAAPIRQLKRAFDAAHTRIREVARLKQEFADMLTTCIAAVVKGNQLLIAHVGDCRAYLLRPSSTSGPSITRLTTDHSLLTALEGAGLISPKEMHSSPARHKLLRALGEEKPEKASPDMTTCLVQTGDRLLLCSDGLWSELPEQQMAMIVSQNTPPEACIELIRLANEAGGEDNISAVVLSFV